MSRGDHPGKVGRPRNKVVTCKKCHGAGCDKCKDGVLPVKEKK
jgi:hypothetical protein